MKVTPLVDEDGYVRDDLTGLGPDSFEQLCRALAIRVLGPGITAFGSGRDGGREASFSGRQQYPNLADPWDGYGVVQAKYKDQLLGATADATWLRGQVKAELDDWADPSKRRVRDGRRPEYLVLATNVPLSSVPGSGGKDRTDELIRGIRCPWPQGLEGMGREPDQGRSSTRIPTSSGRLLP